MRKLYSYLLRSFLGPWVATFFISLFVLFMQFIWKWVDELVGKGLDWSVLGQLFFYISLTFVPMALPLSLLLSSLMMFGNLGERYELVAMKAAGISMQKMMLPLFVVIFFVCVGTFFYSNIVLPLCELKSRSILWDVREKKLVFNIPEGIFYSGMDGYVIKVDKKKKDLLYGVMIYDHMGISGNKKLTLADSAKMAQSSDNNFLILNLFNGINYEELDNNNPKRGFQRTSFSEQTIRFDLSQFKFSRTDQDMFRNNYRMLNQKRLKHNIDSLTSNIQKRVEDTRTMLSGSFRCLSSKVCNDSLFKLDTAKSMVVFPDSIPNATKLAYVNSALEILRQTKSNVEFNKTSIKEQREFRAKHEIEWHRKLTLALACLALFMLGAPLGTIIRKGGLGMPLVVSVLLFVLYHTLSFTGEKIVRTGNVPVWEGMWIPTTLFLFVGIFLTYKASTDSPIMDSDIYNRYIRKAISVFKKKSKPHEDPPALQ